MSTYKIINGNCIKELKKIEANSINLIFADPPYWMRVSGVLKRVEGTDYDGCADEWDNQFESLDDYIEFTRNWLKECYRVLSPNGSMWVIGGMQCIYTIGNAMQEIAYWLINDIIWYKTSGASGASVHLTLPTDAPLSFSLSRSHTACGRSGSISSQTS